MFCAKSTAHATALHIVQLGARKQFYLLHFSPQLLCYTPAIHCTGTAYRSTGRSKTLLITTPEPLCMRKSCHLFIGVRNYLLFTALEPNPLFEVTFEIAIRNHMLLALHPDAHYAALPSSVHEYAQIYTTIYTH